MFFSEHREGWFLIQPISRPKVCFLWPQPGWSREAEWCPNTQILPAALTLPHGDARGEEGRWGLLKALEWVVMFTRTTACLLSAEAVFGPSGSLVIFCSVWLHINQCLWRCHMGRERTRASTPYVFLWWSWHYCKHHISGMWKLQVPQLPWGGRGLPHSLSTRLLVLKSKEHRAPIYWRLISSSHPVFPQLLGRPPQIPDRMKAML